MRISDWSSDVCSSDLQNITGARRLALIAAVRSEDYDSFGRVTTPKLGVLYDPSADFTLKASWGKSFKAPTLLHRSEEHTSELQSLMRISYAVFCLKKKKKSNKQFIPKWIRNKI